MRINVNKLESMGYNVKAHKQYILIEGKCPWPEEANNALGELTSILHLSLRQSDDIAEFAIALKDLEAIKSASL